MIRPHSTTFSNIRTHSTTMPAHKTADGCITASSTKKQPLPMLSNDYRWPPFGWPAINVHLPMFGFQVQMNNVERRPDSGPSLRRIWTVGNSEKDASTIWRAHIENRQLEKVEPRAMLAAKILQTFKVFRERCLRCRVDALIRTWMYQCHRLCGLLMASSCGDPMHTMMLGPLLRSSFLETTSTF